MQLTPKLNKAIESIHSGESVHMALYSRLLEKGLVDDNGLTDKGLKYIKRVRYDRTKNLIKISHKMQEAINAMGKRYKDDGSIHRATLAALVDRGIYGFEDYEGVRIYTHLGL
jgi:hypothetical protein